MDSKMELEQLITKCKNELLNHTLQEEIVSPYIKNINGYLDKCLGVLCSTVVASKKATITRKARFVGEDKDNVLFFAFCMSRWDSEFVSLLTKTHLNQTEAFNYLAEKLDVKVNTLRNYRDTFDSHVAQVRSNRQGWKKPLNTDEAKVLEKYKSFTEEMAIDLANSILS